MPQLHPFATLENARRGHLESPAYLRKALAPKVNIGSKYEPRKRETLDIREGVYKGFNPEFDNDAFCLQKAMLTPKALGEFSERPPRRLADVLWGVLAVFLVITLVVLILSQGNGLPPEILR